MLVDEVMDMARTCTNVIGNCLACVVIAKWEGVYVENHIPVVRRKELMIKT
jgi:proton glutamate symport protein